MLVLGILIKTGCNSSTAIPAQQQERTGRGKLISKLRIALQHAPFFIVYFEVGSINLEFTYKSQISVCSRIVMGAAKFGSGEEMAPGQLFLFFVSV